MEENIRKRVVFVDIAKGISIILVVVHHLVIINTGDSIDISRYMGVFRLPLFFFISGLFFNDSLNPIQFLAKKSDALLKPYFIILLIAIAFLNVQIWGNAFIVKDTLIRFFSMFYGTEFMLRNISGRFWGPLWFLPHLFSVYVFTYAVFYLFKNIKSYQVVILMVFLYVLGLLTIGSLHNFNNVFLQSGLPFSIDILPITSVFFMLGVFFKKKVLEFKIDYLILSLACIVFGIVIFFWNDFVFDLNTRNITHPFQSLLGAVCGIYIVLSLSYILKEMKYVSYIFIKCGRSSLFILMFHCLLYYFFRYLIETLFSTVIAEMFVVNILLFVVIIFFSVVMYNIVSNSNIYFFFLPIKSKTVKSSVRIGKLTL